MKKYYWIFGIILTIIILVMVLRFPGGEDSWIKDDKGVYIKHGNPSQTPDYVKAQQEAISCALNLYSQKKQEGMQFNSQCLGTCGDYAVDIVHVPKTSEDNLAENQCQAYMEGKASHFIELDKEGNICNIV